MTDMWTRSRMASAITIPTSVLRDELWMEFRQLQRMRMPQLSGEQAAELFDVWLLRDLSRLVAARDKALKDILAAIDEVAARNGKPSLLLCKCGEMIPQSVLRRDGAGARAAYARALARY